MQWSDVLDDPSLRDLPYKIELDAQGRLLMSPASNRHGIQQAKLVRLLASRLIDGELATECSIGTHAGVKVADVVWMSPAFLRQHGDTTPYPQAPELCIEILSPSNTAAEMQDKIRLYLGYGAQEVWTLSDAGRISLFGPEGERSRSILPGIGTIETL
ncbi:MAG: Uma2 family endonuclease [Halochromatium sp.]